VLKKVVIIFDLDCWWLL